MEDAGIDFDLFDAGTVEFFKSGYDASLFASAGGSVDEEVRKVARLCLGDSEWWGVKGERWGTYERAQTIGEVMMVGQLIEGPWTVFIYEERHVVWFWCSEFLGENWRDREWTTRRVDVA